MAKIWSIRGVPLKIQTNILERYDNGLNFDIVQKAMISPSGSAKTSVNIKSASVVTNPLPRFDRTFKKTCIKTSFTFTKDSPQIAANPSAYTTSKNYLLRASVLRPTPYFSARSVIVPSAYFALRKASSESLRSLP